MTTENSVNIIFFTATGEIKNVKATIKLKLWRLISHIMTTIQIQTRYDTKSR